MNVFDEKHRLFAIEKLGLSDEWTLVYQSVDVPFLYDSSDVSDQLKKEHGEDVYEFGIMDIEAAVDEATIHVMLPDGLRMVGMKLPDTGERFYGLVDFSSIEHETRIVNAGCGVMSDGYGGGYECNCGLCV